MLPGERMGGIGVGDLRVVVIEADAVDVPGGGIDEQRRHIDRRVADDDLGAALVAASYTPSPSVEPPRLSSV